MLAANPRAAAGPDGPDGATVTALTFVYFDADPGVDGAAYLYRSDDTVLAGIGTQGSKAEVQVSGETRESDPSAGTR